MIKVTQKQLHVLYDTVMVVTSMRTCGTRTYLRTYVAVARPYPDFLMLYRAIAMASFSLHFRMANSNSIACFVGLPSRSFTNYHSDSINQVERHPFI